MNENSSDLGWVQIAAPPKVGPELSLIKVKEQNIEGKGLDLKLELKIFWAYMDLGPGPDPDQEIKLD